MDTAEPDTLIGLRVFGGYEVTQRIGAGGMGAVYLAENRSLGRRLAIKVLLADREHSPQAVARFLAEAKAASAIRHRNIIDVLDTALLPDGRHYILMEHLQGSTLRDFAREHFPLTLEAVLAVLGQVCAGLQAAHDRGIIHRDLKPSNIFVAPEPDNPYLTKLLDFGIAKLSAPDLSSDAMTKSRTVAGTPYYMSPEQARALRDVDHRTDIYALGVIAYEMVTGRPPYIAASAGDLVYQQQTTTPRPPRDACEGLPDAWNQLILDSIALDADRRPQSAREMAERMIAATERGVQIARATAPLLFTASIAEPSSRPDSRGWSQDSMPVVPPPSRRPGTGSLASQGSRPPGSQPTRSSAPPHSGAEVAPPRPDPTVAPPARPPGTEPPAPRPSGTAPPSSEASQPPVFVTTRNLRAGTGSHPPGMIAEPVPTTLGLSASEIPVFEATAVPPVRVSRRRVFALASFGAVGVAAIVFTLVLLKGRGDPPAVNAAEPPPPAPSHVAPMVTPIDEPVIAPRTKPIIDAGIDAALVPDAAVEMTQAGADDDDDGDRDDRRGDRKTARDRRKNRKVDAGPVSDDDLFESRE